MNSTELRVAALCGSLRRDSINRRLLEAAAAMAPEGMRIEHVAIGRIPPYNADVEKAGLPPPVERLKEAIDVADALLIVTPEYNTSIPGLLKNAIDWVSRPAFRSPFVSKPVALAGATPGRRGTSRMLGDLRRVLESTLAEPLPHAVSVAQAHEKLAGTEIVDAALEREMRHLLEALGEAGRRRDESEAGEVAARRAAS